MINFYVIYSHGGLDKEEYAPLIEQLVKGFFTLDLKPIEHIIKKDPVYAYNYARDVIKGRWLEAEPYIITDTYSAYWYACYVMKERWLEAEPLIKKSEVTWQRYGKVFSR
jgi:hypothetical protein